MRYATITERSARDRRVSEMKQDGYTNAEIGRRLGISKEAVRKIAQGVKAKEQVK